MVTNRQWFQMFQGADVSVVFGIVIVFLCCFF